jgi:hypothetical protein
LPAFPLVSFGASVGESAMEAAKRNAVDNIPIGVSLTLKKG